MIVITFDVLAHEGEDLGSRQPSLEGRKLWNMFFSQYQGRICVLATGYESDKMPILMGWLMREGYKAGSVDISYERTPDATLERVRSLQAGYGRIDWFIGTNPKTVAFVIHEGIASLLVSIPSIPRPEWHKRQDIREWDALSKEIEAQALVKAEKSWKD